jgi:tetratricopeptide (TPR) repeat protein
MTVTLGTKVRFAATAGVLALGLGCATEQAPPKTSHETPIHGPPTGDLQSDVDPLPSDVAKHIDPTLQDEPYFKARAIYLHGLELFNHRKWAEASLEFDSALNAFPKYYRAWSKKGLCAYELQEFNVEKFCYQQCLRIQPDYAEALQNLGNAYLYDDEIEKAVPLYHQILEVDPKHPVALFNLGICYFELRDYPRSVDNLNRFLQAHPESQDRAKAERVLDRANLKWRELGSPALPPPNVGEKPR